MNEFLKLAAALTSAKTAGRLGIWRVAGNHDSYRRLWQTTVSVNSISATTTKWLLTERES